MRAVVATHGHCFDGLCSAVVFSRLLTTLRGPLLRFHYASCGYSPTQRPLEGLLHRRKKKAPAGVCLPGQMAPKLIGCGFSSRITRSLPLSGGSTVILSKMFRTLLRYWRGIPFPVRRALLGVLLHGVILIIAAYADPLLAHHAARPFLDAVADLVRALSDWLAS